MIVRNDKSCSTLACVTIHHLCLRLHHPFVPPNSLQQHYHDQLRPFSLLCMRWLWKNLSISSESLKVQDQTLESCFKVLQRFLKSSLWSFSSQLLQFILRRRKAVYQNSPKHFPFRERKNNGVEKVRWYLHPGRDTFERKVVEMWGAAQNKVSLCRSAVFCGKQERKKLCFSFIILKLQMREIIECEWTGFFLVERTNILISDMFRSTF